MTDTEQQQWEAILLDPGLAGTDYDPLSLTVSYRLDAHLPAGSTAAAPPAGLRAADQRNALLRVEPGFEELTDAIATAHGLRIDSQVYKGAVRSASFRLPAEANGDAVIAAIRQQFAEQLDYVTYSRKYQPHLVPDDPDYIASTEFSGPCWSMHRLRCAEAWDATLGSEDVWIAVIDTGVNMQHEELAGQVLVPAVEFPGVMTNLADGNNDPTDDWGHGSGCSGLAVAAVNNGRTIAGVAPGCRVLPIRIGFNDAQIVEAGYLAEALGARIVSMSFGGGFPDPLTAAMCADLYSLGLLLIASAGNENTTDTLYPAGHEHCMSVGATDINDARINHEGWWGSNYGPTVAIAAPGEGYLSCGAGAPDSYEEFGGTSGSAPHVAACAALLWSMRPELTNDEVRAALIATAVPTTGFLHDVPRVDAGNLLAEYATGFRLTPLHQMLVQGTLTVEPSSPEDLLSLTAMLDGAVAQELHSAPWALNIDTTQTQFAPLTLSVTGESALVQRSFEQLLVADNQAPTFPLIDMCNAAGGALLPFEAKHLPSSVLRELYKHDDQFSPGALKQAGAGEWQLVDDPSASGGACYFAGLPGGGYDAFEIDCLLTRQIDLRGGANPTLTFRQRYNLEDGGRPFDRAMVLASTDLGASWDEAVLRSGPVAMFSGYAPDWTTAEIDLSEYAGTLLHVALVLVTDESISGEDQGQPAGWWVDDLLVAQSYATLAGSGVLNIEPFTVVGTAVDRATVELELTGGVGVEHVEYVLDCAPLGQADPYDVTLQASGDGRAMLFVPLLPNQVALLTVRSFGAGDAPLETFVVPLSVFNLRGDANADNAVDQADLEYIRERGGARRGDAHYSPFADGDSDGVLTEADAASVGYNWGLSL